MIDHNLLVDHWTSVLGHALHCVHSLINRATKAMPHDQFFNFEHRICPSPLSFLVDAGRYTWLHQHVRNKNSSSGNLVKVVAAYPGYAVVSNDDGKSTNIVNWRHLAPHPGPPLEPSDNNISPMQSVPLISPTHSPTQSSPSTCTEDDGQSDFSAKPFTTRAGRLSKPPVRYGFESQEDVG